MLTWSNNFKCRKSSSERCECSKTSSYRWKREGRKSEIKTAKTDQPITENCRSLKKQNWTSLFLLADGSVFSPSDFQSNNHTINKKFTVINNMFDIHFLCVFRQSEIVPAWGKGFQMFYRSKNSHQVSFFKTSTSSFLKCRLSDRLPEC